LKPNVFSKTTFKEAVFIIIIASILGISTNAINPKGVTITSNRPSLISAPDSIFAQDLPAINISDERLKDMTEPAVSGESILINTEQVHQLLIKDQARLLDARSEAEFQKEHIPNSINLPYESLSDYEEILRSLPQDKWLVCFCEGPPCDLGELLANELINAGYTRVVTYHEGLNAWKKAGRNVEEG
jgi:rhodanese-related sulfurtransferase